MVMQTKNNFPNKKPLPYLFVSIHHVLNFICSNHQ